MYIAATHNLTVYQYGVPKAYLTSFSVKTNNINDR